MTTSTSNPKRGGGGGGHDAYSFSYWDTPTSDTKGGPRSTYEVNGAISCELKVMLLQELVQWFINVYIERRLHYKGRDNYKSCGNIRQREPIQSETPEVRDKRLQILRVNHEVRI